MALALDPRYVIELQPSRGRPAGRPAVRPAVRPASMVGSRRPAAGSHPSSRTPSLTVRQSRDHSVYLRRRVAVLLAVVSVVAVSLLLGRAIGADAAPSGVGSGSSAVVPADQAPATYLARPGDTMWAIAQRFAGDAPVGSYVDDLVEVNGGASIQAGQLIVLP